jgi:uncharacterized protein (TIGR02001 family)
MKTSKKLLAGAIAASVMSLGAVAPVAQAEVSGSIGIANMYYWRGHDLGLGDASVNGGIEFSESGLYGGMWAGSGDIVNGQEYDLYVGYGGGDPEAFNFDVSVWTYAYPSTNVAPGDLAEVVVGLGFGPVSFTYYEGIADLEDYNYFTLGLSLDKFSITYGKHEDDSGLGAHVDLGYSVTDNLGITLGMIVDDEDGALPDEPLFVVGYSIPLE